MSLNFSSMRQLRFGWLWVCCWALLCSTPSQAFASSAAAAATVLKDHSGAASSLFNNMRTPAALIGGALVPLGILSAPQVKDDDSKRTKVLKKLNIILGVASLLSEILAVTYSSIAINKLVEIPSEPTKDVAELISKNHELAWIGTNVHFLLGMMGFGLIVGAKGFFFFGGGVGKISASLAFSAFLQALNIVNRGIAQGHGDVNDMSTRFASNLFFLMVKYMKLVLANARTGVCGMGAVALLVYALFVGTKEFLLNNNDSKDKSD